MDSGQQIEYKAVFQSLPIICAVLTAKNYRYVAVTDLYADAAGRSREDILDKLIFKEFPDNPFKDVDGSNRLKKSFETVKKTKVQHKMGILRYDIEMATEEGSQFVEKWWRVTNNPILDSKGKVEFIIHTVEDLNHMLDVLEGAEDAFTIRQKPDEKALSLEK